MTTPTTTNTTTSTSQATPQWYDELALNFANTLSQGVTNIGNLPNNWYSDPLTQGFNPLQTGAINAAGTAGGAWTPGLSSAGTTLNSGVNQATTASNFNPGQTQQFMNPYLQGAQTATINASNQNLFENILPKVNSTFAGQGQFGSSRNADFMNRAIDNQQSTLTDAIGTLNYGAMDNALKNQLAWGQLGTQGAQVLGGLGQVQQNLGTATATNTWDDLMKQLQIGGVQQAQGQKELDTSYQDWQTQLSTPINMMGALSQILPNISQLYKGNQTQVITPNGSESGALDYIIAAIMGAMGGQQPAPAP